MASTYVNDLRLNEMATGDASGTWGTTTNTNLELIAEAFSYGTEAITTNADTHTTTIADGATDPGRSMFLKYTGALDSACTVTIGPNTVSKMWFIENATTGSQNLVISQGTGASITIPAGDTKIIYSDGAGSGGAMVDALASISAVDLKVQDDLTVTDDASVGGNLTLTGNGDFNGDLDVDGTTNLDVVDIDGAVDMATTLTLAGNADFNGDLDVDGTTNLDVVDIDGAVDMASTLAVTGIVTLTDDLIIGDGKTIGSASDVDAMTIASNGQVTFTQTLIGTALDISGDVDVDGTLETDNLTIGSAQGSDGQVLTSTGSGVAWEDAAGGASSINDLSDAKTFGTSSIMLGDATTGTISGANYNVGLGIDVFEDLTTGDNNVGVGFRALYNLTTGEQNVALGNSTLLQLTTASNNTAVGQSALNANTSGAGNVAVGHEAMDAITTGGNNTAVGKGALGSATTAADNTAIGYEALTSTNNTRNLGIGYRALTAQSGSSDNIAIGYDALVRQTTGANGNIAIGNYAGRAVVSSASTSQLLAIGHSVASNASGALAGYQNVFIGYNIASTANLAGAFQNTALGGSAMTALSTGDQNTCIGNRAGDAITTGSNNVLIGYDSGSDALTTVSTGSNNIVLGNNSTAVAEVKVDWTVGSDERDKTDIENLPNNAGLNFVNQLRPVTYVWDNRSNYYKPTDEKYGERDHSKKSTTKQVGFIAQEVKAIEESIGWTEDHIVNTSNEQSYKLTYSQVIPMLTKAVQELSAKVEELEKKLN
jgi:hypothetical protein